MRAFAPSYPDETFVQEVLAHIQRFLLELGVGFAFVGSEYHLVVGEEDYYLDLLFYHIRLRCFVVIELKTGEFKPEYAGKMNFYLRFTRFCGGPKHSDSPINCSHA